MSTRDLARPRKRASRKLLSAKSDPFTDLALTLPILVAYHLGVVFLPVRNAADVLTDNLASLASYNLFAYAGLALGIAAVLIIVCMALGRGRPFQRTAFARVLLEGTVYAIVMRITASLVALHLPLAASSARLGPFAGVVMSLGAGFYEETAFRVLLYGQGKRLVAFLMPKRASLVPFAWALVTSAVFSTWHYLGPEAFELHSFVFRMTCGLVLTAIFTYRGFATAVWTHALYDIWVLV